MPSFLGVKVVDVALDELTDRIDWTPFFQAWELAGRYPRILTDEVVGEEASKLFEDAKAMLARIVTERWLTARALIGLFPANSVNHDDIEIYADESRTTVRMTLHHLRQQMARQGGPGNFCLADFIAPKQTGVRDYLGAFAVTAGIGIDDRVARYEAQNNDYDAIMLKALADRLAEALAERIHERVRQVEWGYAPEESLPNDALIAEEYRGIRPAPGYPACPDHTEKALLWSLLTPAQRIGLSLTETYAMWPSAAVSGWYFSHPDARYFGLGKIGQDQVADYAKRKGMTLAEAEQWLGPVLAY